MSRVHETLSLFPPWNNSRLHVHVPDYGKRHRPPTYTASTFRSPPSQDSEEQAKNRLPSSSLEEETLPEPHAAPALVPLAQGQKANAAHARTQSIAARKELEGAQPSILSHNRKGGAPAAPAAKVTPASVTKWM